MNLEKKSEYGLVILGNSEYRSSTDSIWLDLNKRLNDYSINKSVPMCSFLCSYYYQV